MRASKETNDHIFEQKKNQSRTMYRPGANLEGVPASVWFGAADADGDGVVSPGEFDPMLGDEMLLDKFDR